MRALEKLRGYFRKVGIQDHVEVGILVFLACITRLIPRKRRLPLILTGASSTGKSTIAKKALRLVHPDDKIEVSFITPAALIRFDDVSDKVIYLQETIKNPTIEAPLRLLASEGEVKYYLFWEGRCTEIKLTGPCVVIETTTNPDAIGFESRNRSLVISIEPNKEELENRFRRIANKWVEPSREDDEEINRLCDYFHNLQRKLNPKIDVVIPFANYIDFSSQHWHTQRLFEHYLLIVAAIAFLEQANRTMHISPEGQVYVEATVADYREAYNLVRSVQVDTGTDIMPEKAAQLFAAIKANEKLCSPTPFGRTDVARNLDDWTPKQVRKWIEVLVDNDLLRRRTGRKNRFEYTLTPIGKKFSPDEIFQNCYATLVSPDDLERLTSLTSDAKWHGQAQPTFPDDVTEDSDQLAQDSAWEVYHDEN